MPQGPVQDAGGSAPGPAGTAAAAAADAAAAVDLSVTVRYWAGARAAAGVAEDLVSATTVGAALEVALARRPGLAGVLPVATLLLDGRSVHRDAPTGAGSVVEVLPPFAGG